MRNLLGTATVATLFGFSLSQMGFSSWDEVHRMFTLADLRLFFTFLCAVGILTLAWRIVLWVSHPKPPWPPQKLHRGTILGGAIFGAGWALCGACPSISLVQLGEGQGLAALTLAGIFVGNWLYSLIHQYYLKWDTTSCLDN